MRGFSSTTDRKIPILNSLPKVGAKSFAEATKGKEFFFDLYDVQDLKLFRQKSFDAVASVFASIAHNLGLLLGISEPI